MQVAYDDHINKEMRLHFLTTARLAYTASLRCMLVPGDYVVVVVYSLEEVMD